MPAIVNFKHKFVFIHIPKTAGRSVCRALMSINGSYMFDVTEVEKQNFIVGSANWLKTRLANLTLRDRLKLGLYNITYNKFDLSEFDFIFVIRHPLERAVSSFNYCLSTINFKGKKLHAGKALPDAISFQEFICLDEKYNYEYYNHFSVSQVDYSSLDPLYNSVLIPFDKLEERLNCYFNKRIGLDLKLSKVNASKSNSFNVSQVNGFCRDYIASRFSKDFVLYSSVTEN